MHLYWEEDEGFVFFGGGNHLHPSYRRDDFGFRRWFPPPPVGTTGGFWV